MTVPRKKSEQPGTPEKTASIEENFAQLEAIIKKLEAGEDSLEETRHEACEILKRTDR